MRPVRHFTASFKMIAHLEFDDSDMPRDMRPNTSLLSAVKRLLVILCYGKNRSP